MAVLTKQTASRSANAITMAAAAAGGDKFDNTGSELVLIKNGSGSPVTLTITTPATMDGLAVTDRTVAIPAGEMHLLGPWPTKYYNDSNGQVSLGYSAETSVEVAIIGV